MDVSMLNGVVVFILRKHDTRIPSKSPIFIRLDIQYDGPSNIQIVHPLRQEIILRSSKFKFELTILKRQYSSNLILPPIRVKLLNLLLEYRVEVDQHLLFVDHLVDLLLLTQQSFLYLGIYFLRDGLFVVIGEMHVVCLTFVEFFDLRKPLLAVLAVNIREQIDSQLLKYSVEVVHNTLLVFVQLLLEFLSSSQMFLDVGLALLVVIIVFDKMTWVLFSTFIVSADEALPATLRIVAD